MKLGLDPDHEYKETVVAICYDATNKRTATRRVPDDDERFYIRLPQVVADALAMTEVRAKDQDAVFDVFKKTLETFKNMKTAFYVEPNPGRKLDTYSTVSGLSVTVWAGTYEEVVAIAGDGKRRYSYERVESALKYPTIGIMASPFYASPFYNNHEVGGGDRYLWQIPWTEENEKFFAWAQGCMEELGKRLIELAEPKALLESINAGRFLPIGEPPQHYDLRGIKEVKDGA